MSVPILNLQKSTSIRQIERQIINIVTYFPTAIIATPVYLAIIEDRQVVALQAIWWRISSILVGSEC